MMSMNTSQIPREKKLPAFGGIAKREGRHIMTLFQIWKDGLTARRRDNDRHHAIRGRGHDFFSQRRRLCRCKRMPFSQERRRLTPFHGTCLRVTIKVTRGIEQPGRFGRNSRSSKLNQALDMGRGIIRDRGSRRVETACGMPSRMMLPDALNTRTSHGWLGASLTWRRPHT
jgi:hypothetical protein